VSPHEAWAVGDYYTAREGGPHGTFIERWDGRRWRLASAPIPRGAILWSVSASGEGNVWAVGQADRGGQLIEHWDGVRWRVVAPPSRDDGILYGVAARTPRDAWAVGVHNRGGGGRTLIEHWDGTSWTVVPSPNPPRIGRRSYAILQAVVVISPTNAWAAGSSGTFPAVTAVTRTLTEHWDGRRWTIVPSPNVRSGRVTNDILFSISGTPNGVWAVGSWGSVPGGYGGKGDHPLALHWNGRRWSLVPPAALGHRGLFSAVLARNGGVWTVGDRGHQPHQQTLIEHWNGARLSIVPSPRGFGLASLSGARGPAWAVGANGRRTLAARCVRRAATS
jgi:hypothetical protein